MKTALLAIGAIIFYIFAIIATIGAWIQHVITCIATEQWILLVVGAIVAPVGVIHGWGVWLGVW